MNNILKPDQPMYSPSVHHGHRSSFSEVNNGPRHGSVSFAPGYPPQHADGSRTGVKPRVSIPASNAALAAAHLQSSPSVLSAQASPQEAVHQQDVFYNQAHSGQVVNYRPVQQGDFQSVSMTAAPGQPVVYSQPMVGQPGQGHQGQPFFEALPYQEPVQVLPVGHQQYHLPRQYFGVTSYEEYKPEDMIMMVPNQEFMTPSMRANQGLQDGF